MTRSEISNREKCSRTSMFWSLLPGMAVKAETHLRKQWRQTNATRCFAREKAFIQMHNHQIVMWYWLSVCKLTWRRYVNFEFRYGMCCSLFPIARMTSPRLDKLLLIAWMTCTQWYQNEIFRLDKGDLQMQFPNTMTVLYWARKGVPYLSFF